MYKVGIGFPERFDDNHNYKAGDVYPREGFTPPKGRAEALASGEKSELNRTGQVYLKVVEDAPKKAKKKQETSEEEKE